MTTQFSDFYTSLDPDPLKRGKQFEHFVLWFLKASTGQSDAANDAVFDVRRLG